MMHDYDGGIEAKTTKVDLLIAPFIGLRVDQENLSMFLACFAVEIAMLHFSDDDTGNKEYIEFIASIEKHLADHRADIENS